jgi:hypothetical protein
MLGIRKDKVLFFLLGGIITIGIILTAYFVSAAVSGPRSGGTFANDTTVGSRDWYNVGNAATSDDTYALFSIGVYLGVFEEYSIRIVKGGIIQGDEKSTNATLPGSDAYVSYGSSDDLWGLSWTPGDINAADFGVVFSVDEGPGSITHYLKATNFGFSVPTDATINGILAEIEQKYIFSGEIINTASVDHIRITVYYTENSCTAPNQNNNWEISMSDACNITSLVSLGTGNITFVGTGEILFNSTISAGNIGSLGAGQTLNMGSNATLILG